LRSGRIPHAQIFEGSSGSGSLALAIAYASDLLKLNAPVPEDTERKCNSLVHPDLHFVFPVATTSSVKKHPVSDLFLEQWRNFVLENPFRDYFDWLNFIGAEKKQGQIGVDESQALLQKMSLKSYEGGYKVVIIWCADRLNISASNKLLKLIEEPPKNTVFILITSSEELLISTIRSRCQLLTIPSLDKISSKEFLKNKYPDKTEQEIDVVINRGAGNINEAIKLIENPDEDYEFEKWFIVWVRAAFKAKGDASVIEQLIDWSDEIASKGREKQKEFLSYCSEFFRQALMMNYGLNSLNYLTTKTPGFDLTKFAPFIHGANIEEISKELDKASYHIERNGNAKLILLDTSIKLTRLLHQKN
jgi:DNA polymerase-3 subunit delta'